jgi:hypothetical protein
LVLRTLSEAGADDWYDGIVYRLEMPPPPAPASLELSFHTVSVGGGPRAVKLVPPTPVTYGWLAGSSTASDEVSQSEEPLSPAAAKTDWPSVADSWKRVASSEGTVEPDSASQSPQEVETTWAPLVTMAV